MTRGVGGHRLVEGLPETAIAAAGIVTQLGDLWFLLVAVGVVFALSALDVPVVDDRWRDPLYLLALVVGAYALTTLLKHAFALPRPPGAGTATPPAWLPTAVEGIYASLVTAQGYGFPSGHAVSSTAVYGGGALVLRVGDSDRRLAIAGVVIAAVAASRVVLGAHYLVDVVVGICVGAAFLRAAERFTRRTPVRALVLASGLGLAAAAVILG